VTHRYWYGRGRLWLVEDHQRRVAEERARQREPLPPLAGGQVVCVDTLVS
jgi:hypothetical protein